jgi:hypothetical protein
LDFERQIGYGADTNLARTPGTNIRGSPDSIRAPDLALVGGGQCHVAIA